MATVGELLRKARLEQGLDLATLAAGTKIKEVFLAAVEADDRKRLPHGGFFYKSFVRQYAAALGLAYGELEAEVDRSLSFDEPLPLPGQDEPSTAKVVPRVPEVRESVLRHGGRALSSVAVLVLVLASCSGFYAWWKNRREANSSQRRMTAALGRSQKHMQQPPASPVIVAPAPVQAPVHFAERADVAPSPSAASNQLELELKATERTWVTLSSDGKRVFRGTLLANQTRTIEGRENAEVHTGNAGGLEVRWNGRFLGSLGARGQVRTVVFTRDEYKIVSQSPEEDSASIADATR